jgi:hypothetical protein
LLGCPDALVNGELSGQNVTRMGDLAASLAAQIALEQWFEHQHQRKPLPPMQDLFDDVSSDSQLLNGWYAQGRILNNGLNKQARRTWENLFGDPPRAPSLCGDMYSDKTNKCVQSTSIRIAGGSIHAAVTFTWLIV